MLISCNSQTADIETISPKAFAEKMDATSNPQLLDVRTSEEFAADHIDGAVNVDWNGADFAEKAAKFDKSEPVFVYCKVGGRSAQAASKLQEMGFTKVYNLDGGILKWNSENPSKSEGEKAGMTMSEFQNILRSDKPVLIDFTATWCPPCKMMKPYLLKMQQENKDVTIVMVDADANRTLLEEMKIDGLPTLILYKEGKETWKHVGFIAEDELKKQLQ